MTGAEKVSSTMVEDFIATFGAAGFVVLQVLEAGDGNTGKEARRSIGWSTGGARGG